MNTTAIRYKLLRHIAGAMLFVLSIALTASCRREQPRVSNPNEIHWNILTPRYEYLRYSTKSMVNDLPSLQEACTAVENGGKGKAIGFFADYFVEPDKLDDPKHEVIYNVFGAKETRLIYDDESVYKWEYAEGAYLPWTIGGGYHIRAYYPQELSSKIVPSAAANCLVMEYSTHELQEDLMIAYNRVLTIDPQFGNRASIAIAQDPITGNALYSGITGDYESGWGYTREFNLSSGIPLYFAHSLAAVRVRFAYDYIEEEEEEEDELLSCFLSNSAASGGLHTTGVLIYGHDGETIVSHTQSEKEDLEESYNDFKWDSHQSAGPGVPFYQWGVANDGTGIKFSQTTSQEGAITVLEDMMAIAYSKYNRHYYTRYENGVVVNGAVGGDGKKHGEEIPGTTELVMVKESAPYYNENDGWLLILPQQAPTCLQITFTTKKLGTHTLNIPPYTGTDINGADPKTTHLPSHFLAGHRYTYTLNVDEVNGHLTLAISDWEDLKSTQSIDI